MSHDALPVRLAAPIRSRRSAPFVTRFRIRLAILASIAILPALALMTYYDAGERREAAAIAEQSRQARLAAGRDTFTVDASPTPSGVDWEYLRGLGILTITALLSAIVGGQLFVDRPIRRLAEAADRIAAGDLGARASIAVSAPGIGELAGAFDAMAAALESRDRESRVSEERYQVQFQARRLLAAIVADTEDAIIGKDLDGIILSWNAGAERLYGYSATEAIGRSISLIFPDAARELPPLLARIHAGERLKHFQTVRRRKDGSMVTVSLTLSPVHDAEGAVVGASAIARDLSDQLEAQQALVVSHDRFRQITETIAEVFWMADVDIQKMAYVSPAYEHIWGRSCESLYQDPQSFIEAIHPDDRAGFFEVLGCQRTGQPFDHEYRIIRPDGEVRWISDRGFPVVRADGTVHQYVGAARDITSRRAAERALSDAEERMRFALEASHVGIWEANLATDVSYWSEECERMHGLAPGAFGRSFEAFMALIHAEDRDEVGRRIAVAMQNHCMTELEYRTVWPSGETHRILTKAQFSYDAEGAPIRGAGTAMDVTERRSLEDQLRQSQKMEAIGQLAGGIAHDFNNVLTAILGDAQLLLLDLPAGDRSRSDVDDIIASARRAASLTRQLLAFSRKQILTPRVLHIGDIVTDLSPMLRRLLGETIELQTITGDRALVKADAGQLEQVLVNLAVNAHDAMPDGGTLQIQTNELTIEGPQSGLPVELTPGRYVRVTVTDSGIGMDAATQARAFEPFFTTKELGKGTGLGLAMVYGIVRQSAGHITLSSTVGEGTRFDIYLPITQEVEDDSPMVQAAVAPPSAGETILLVEDEAGVREFIHRALSRRGYIVHAMPDPTRAIAFAEAHWGPIHAVVTDVSMPEMSGPTMSERVRALHPETAVLFISGYADLNVFGDSLTKAGTHFLAKPFTVDDLVASVHGAIHNDAPELVGFAD